MNKRSAATAALIAVVTFVMLAGLVAAQQDKNTNTNQNSNSSQNSNSNVGRRDRLDRPATKKEREQDQNMNQNGNTNTGGQSGGSSSGASQNTTLSSSDRKFIMEAAMGGMEEVELGRLAAERGSTDAVKQFGQRMVDDHTKANQELMQIASTKGVTEPTALDAKHSADVAKMSQLTGADFDRRYIKEAGVKDHNKAVKLFQREADQGKDADLKAFAAKTLPTIQEHLRMAQAMDTGMGGNKNMSSGNANMSGNSNTSGNMNTNSGADTTGNSNTSNSNATNTNTMNSNTSNSNMSNSNTTTTNDNTSDNSNMSDNSNTTNSNGNSNTTNTNGNSNKPR